jgi:hypothetical protein
MDAFMPILLFLLWSATTVTNGEHVAALREQIKGRENLPATEVFKNIQVMKQSPAGRLLSVMEMGYARSLGVNCDHCHTPGKWEDDGKAPKQIAREMSLMVRRINTEILPAIAALKDRAPLVNCTTCHRGDVKPALNLPSGR